MKIYLAEKDDQPIWDDFVLNHPQGIAYQLWAWKEAVENAYRFKTFYLMAKKNHQVVGVFPLVQVKLPSSSGNLISLPYCDAGGPLADSTEIQEKLILKAVELIGKHPNKKLIVRSTDKTAGIDTDTAVNSAKVRMILRLPEESETLLSSLKAKVRSQIKKPVREGLTCRLGGLDLFSDFYPLFSENMRDLGSPPHSKKWFINILHQYKNRGHVFVVYLPDKRPAAAGILLCHPHIVSVPWASSLRRFNRWNPNMLLYWNFLKFASDSGYPIFDFGRSSPGEGTFRFKKQWGAAPKPLYWAQLMPMKNAAYTVRPETKDAGDANNMRQMAEKILARLPIPVSNTLGAVARKYITL